MKHGRQILICFRACCFICKENPFPLFLPQLPAPDPSAKPACLDLGCGTGNYTLGMQNSEFSLFAVDPSGEMLRQARSRSTEISWLQGSAEAIPLPDRSVDRVSATLTMHHWSDLDRGFSEISRVLRPGGHFVLFTATPLQMRAYWLSHYFPEMLAASIDQMPSKTAIESAIFAAGMEVSLEDPVFIRPDLCDLFLYAGKDRPELYLDPQVRSGISSFADLAWEDEVKNGLAQLEHDIKNGNWTELRSATDDSAGDYLFIVGRHASSG